MTEHVHPLFAPPPPPAAAPSPPAASTVRLSGTRRAIASVLLAAGLFAVGGTAVALAADPSPSQAPSTQPGGGTGTQPGGPGHANGQGCPNMGGSGGASGAPSAPSPNGSPGV